MRRRSQADLKGPIKLSELWPASPERRAGGPQRGAAPSAWSPLPRPQRATPRSACAARARASARGRPVGQQPLAQPGWDLGRSLGGAVEGHEHGVSVGEHALPDPHLEVAAEARSPDRARSQQRLDRLAVAARGAVDDLGLDNHRAEVAEEARVVAGNHVLAVGAPRRLEEGGEGAVVEVAESVEVGEADLVREAERPVRGLALADCAQPQRKPVSLGAGGSGLPGSSAGSGSRLYPAGGTSLGVSG